MRKTIKKVIIAITILGVLGLGWGIFQYNSITKIGEYSEPGKADVIIVLGAAVWPMGPSPALEARMVHSELIYREGLAEAFILSGGVGKYPPSEAEAMKKGLVKLGIREEVLFLEDKATNTRENIKFSKEIMDQNGWETAIIVTDAFHLKRALLIASENGIEAFGAPAKNSYLYKVQIYKFRYTIREVLAISQHYLKSFLNI